MPPEPNLLDLLDELRELSPREQAQRLKTLPAASQDQLRQWLRAVDAPADPFASHASALDGKDPELLSHVRQMAERAAAQGSHQNATAPTVGISPAAAVEFRSPGSSESATRDGHLTFQAGDVLLKQYRIVCALGRGGMGEVFRAIDEHAGEQVALKFLPADRKTNPLALGLLQSEVRLAHLVRSPYVCAVHALHLEHDPAPGRAPLPPFIAMQFIEGEDLQTLLKRVERLSGPKVIRIAHELTKGMAAIHAAGILHRDLKPSNVMLDIRGMVQILDFGIAAATHPDDKRSSILAGTPAYMAPEVATDGASVASDSYSLGLLLFELSVGQSASALLQEDRSVRQILEQFADQIPRGLAEPIARCLQPLAADRYASMEEVLEALPAPPPDRSTVRESITAIAKSEAVAALKPWAVAATIAFVTIAAIVAFLIPSPAGSAAATHVSKSPAELHVIALNLARLLGAGGDRYSAHGFAVGSPAPSIAQVPGTVPRRSLYFWYRSSQSPIEPLNAIRGVTATDPPPARGLTTVTLDPDGVLLEAYRPPDTDLTPSVNREYAFPASVAEDLKTMPAVLGQRQWPFMFVDRPSVPVGWLPPLPQVWLANFWLTPGKDNLGHPGDPLLATTIGSHLIYIGRPAAVARMSEAAQSASAGRPPVAIHGLDARLQPLMQWLKRNTTQEFAFWWLYALPSLGLLLAIRNVRLRRVDTRHAVRMAALVFGLSFLGWILTTHPSLAGKLLSDRWNTGIGVSLFIAAEAWISYAAVDPYARVTWKRSLIGYARFTSGWPRGILRDPVVGRSLLTGAAFGLALAVLLKALDFWTPAAGALTSRDQLAAMLLGDGIRTVGLLFRAASSAIVFALLQLVTLVLLHWLTRRRWLATLLFCLVTPLLWALYRNDFSFPAYLIYPAIGVLTALALIHEGVLATAVGLFFSTVLTTLPFTFDRASSNYEASIVVVLLLALFVAAGLRAALPRSVPERWWPSDPIRIGTGEVPRET